MLPILVPPAMLSLASYLLFFLLNILLLPLPADAKGSKSKPKITRNGGKCYDEQCVVQPPLGDPLSSSLDTRNYQIDCPGMSHKTKKIIIGVVVGGNISIRKFSQPRAEIDSHEHSRRSRFDHRCDYLLAEEEGSEGPKCSWRS